MFNIKISIKNKGWSSILFFILVAILISAVVSLPFYYISNFIFGLCFDKHITYQQSTILMFLLEFLKRMYT